MAKLKQFKAQVVEICLIFNLEYRYACDTLGVCILCIMCLNCLKKGLILKILG